MKYVSIILFTLFALLIYTTTASQAGEKIVTPAKITILGDSLIAGYGLEEQDSLPSKLEKALIEDGLNIQIMNAGVSGDTTAGGLERLEWTLADKPDILAIALGGNDGLRAIPPEFTRKNLEQIIVQTKDLYPDVKVMLLGMLAPPNLGTEYSAAFNPIYEDLAAQYELPLYPFLLDGVILEPSLNQNDGIHPNPEGVDVIVEKIKPFFIENITDND